MGNSIADKEEIAIGVIEHYLGIEFTGTTNEEANDFIRLHIEEASEERYMDDHAPIY